YTQWNEKVPNPEVECVNLISHDSKPVVQPILAGSLPPVIATEVGDEITDPSFVGPAGLTFPVSVVAKLAGAKGPTKPVTMAAATGIEAMRLSRAPTANKRFFI
ncbi:MAG: hypothetical protein ACXWI6_24400, partial [Burkholderiales bacterium]